MRAKVARVGVPRLDSGSSPSLERGGVRVRQAGPTCGERGRGGEGDGVGRERGGWAVRGTEEKGKRRKGRSRPDVGAAGPVWLGWAAREEKRESEIEKELGWAKRRKGERGIGLLGLGRKRWKRERKKRGFFEIRRYKQNLFEFKFENLHSIELKQIKQCNAVSECTRSIFLIFFIAK
jgi:hypothetical protein